MDLIYMNADREDIGVLLDYDLDMAIGEDENDFECTIPASQHCCEAGFGLYMDGTEYGGIIDSIESNGETQEVTYSGRTWHGLLGSKVILPLQDGEAKESRVPEGYTELMFIESTGTQYIDTGYTPNNNTRVVMDTEITSGATCFLFGARTNSSANSTSASFSMVQLSGTSLRSDYGSAETAISVSPLQRLSIDKNKHSTTVNGTDVSSAAQTFQCSCNMVLFAVNTAGTISATKLSAKLYSCQIYDNDVLVRDFVPCKDPDGNVGLYDRVTKAFFGNSGTGVFYGTEARALPEGYTQVEYIESTGTQYINTGFVPNQNTRVDFDFVFNSGSVVFSSWGSSKGVLLQSGGTCWYVACGTGIATSSTAPVAGGRVLVRLDKSGFYLDGTFNKSVTVGDFSGGYSLLLSAFTTSATAVGAFSAIEIYSCKIYDNGTLVRDLVPCKNASGVAGLYDMANGVFYRNAGSGTFAVGGTIEVNEDDSANAADTVEIQATDSNDNSLVGRYLVISGDANACIRFILARTGLSSLFEASEDPAGTEINKYQFHRYIDGYSGLTKMLASEGLRLKIVFNGDKITLSAVPVRDYTQDGEFDSDQLDFSVKKKYKTVNHLICLGTGELENRMVIHLYADADGNISHDQTQFGLDEYTAVYDYSNVESAEELEKGGISELKSLWEPAEISVDFDAEGDGYEIGDIVGAVDNVTGIALSATIKKKIVTIKNGRPTISYKVGE